MSDPKGSGKTRDEFEAELIQQMNDRKGDYQLLKVAQAELLRLHHDIEPGTSDGIVAGRRVVAGAIKLNAALDNYQAALRRFTDFTLGIIRKPE